MKESATQSVTDRSANKTETTPLLSNNEPQSKTSYISLLPLTTLIFYQVSGGPFGIEPTIRSSGPLLSILGFTLFPLLWSVPEALVTAELGSAFPCSSAGVAWVEEAFGPNAGMFMGYLSYSSGVTDNAIYPALFLEYLLEIYGEEHLNGWERYAYVIAIAALFTTVNVFGLEFVGRFSLVIAIISMSPFLILCIAGLKKVDIQRWFILPDVNYIADDDLSGWFPASYDNVNWRMYLNNLFWNLNSYDSAASFASDVLHISTYYNAMIFSIFVVSFSYLFPLLIALGATQSSQADWTDGYLATVASQIVGPWLGQWTVISSGISNLGLFHAEMASDAWQIAGMAQRGYAPAFLKRRSKHGTPLNGLALGLLLIVIMSLFNFTSLVEMMNFNYGIAILMEYAAFIQLRITRPNAERPFKIPLDLVGCIVMVTPACFLILLLLCLADWITYLYFVCFCAMGTVMMVLQNKLGFLDRSTCERVILKWKNNDEATNSIGAV